MKDAENYSATLTDPRWQRKRLEIFQRDNFTCMECGANTKTLHVHHLSYKPNNQPWDYPDGNFQTLCWECHESKGDKKFPQKIDMTNFKRLVVNVPYRPKDAKPIAINPERLRKVQQQFLDRHSDIFCEACNNQGELK